MQKKEEEEAPLTSLLQNGLDEDGFRLLLPPRRPAFISCSETGKPLPEGDGGVDHWIVVVTCAA